MIPQKVITLILSIIVFIHSSMLAQKNKDIIEIIKYGSYAPSSHNAQMWSVKIINDSIMEVCLKNKRLLPCVDSENREAWISIGAFVENCIIAASSLGYRTDVKIKVNSVQIKLFSLQQNRRDTNNLTLITNRQTLRTPFMKTPIDSNKIRRISNLSTNVRYFALSSIEGQFISNQAISSYEIQMNDTNKMQELAQWMTFSRKEEKHKRVGITPEALGITGLGRFFYNLFLSEKSVNSNLFRNSSIKSAKKQLQFCAGFIIITSYQNNMEEWVNAGRLLEQVWLTCIKLNIAVHPMSQAIEEQGNYNLLKKELQINGEIQMILRVGNVKKYPQNSKRRIEVENILNID